MSFDYTIHTKSKDSRARTGTLTTPHGVVETPAFVTVGTKASIKSLTPEDLEHTGTQMIFVNTYHMVISPGEDSVAAHKGVHEMSKLNKTIITDSGGFQVFSLGSGGHVPIMGDIQSETAAKTQDWLEKQGPSMVKIHEDGVDFRSHVDGKLIKFTPEFSIDAQKKIGGDLIVAFDEDILNKASRTYTKNSTDRSHRWLDRCIAEWKKPSEVAGEHADDPTKRQKLYGIIHGGRFEDIRRESAQYILNSDVWGIALGGVSVGIKGEQLHQELEWVGSELGDDPRPRHLLGIGTLIDIIVGAQHGFDTFDCVLATRYARMGKLYDTSFEDILKATKSEDYRKDTTWTYNVSKSPNAQKYDPVIEGCECYTCTNFTKSYLYHLFSQKELLAYRLATIHNLYFIESFMKDLRIAVEDGRV